MSTPTPSLAAWCSTAVAASITGLTERSIRRLIAEQRLPAVKFGAGWFIARADLDGVKRRRPGRKARPVSS